MNLLLALHGNPGDPADFDGLAAGLHLAAGWHFAALPRPAGGAGAADLIERMGDEVRRLVPDRLVLMGFSWGAYLACRFAESGPVRPDALILLSPTLTVPEPTSPLLARLAEVPVVREGLAALLARLLPGGFVKRIFAPEAPDPAVRIHLVAQLNSGELWLGALRYKLEQERHPLGPLSPDLCSKVVVLRGEADTVIAWPRQSGLLDGLGPALAVHTIAGAGHSLPWTHQDEVYAIIGRVIEEVVR